jgi:hypothetical protein
MIAIDYNQILNAQFQERKEGYQSVFSLYTRVKSFFYTPWLIRKINKSLTSELLSLKGVYAYLLENVSDLKGKNLKSEIGTIETAIAKFYKLEADLEKRSAIRKYKELSIAHGITKEILDVTYNILRVLKKNSLKTPMADISEEAKIAIGHSQNTLNKILNGR